MPLAASSPDICCRNSKPAPVYGAGFFVRNRCSKVTLVLWLNNRARKKSPPGRTTRKLKNCADRKTRIGTSIHG